MGERVKIKIICGGLESTRHRVTIEEPKVSWWPRFDLPGHGTVQKIDPVSGQFSIVGPGNPLGPAGVAVAYGSFGGPKNPPCDAGQIVNPNGDPFHAFDATGPVKLYVPIEIGPDGTLKFQTIHETAALSTGTPPGLLCSVVQVAFIGPPEEVILSDAVIEAIHKMWLLQNEFGMTAGELVELARQNARDNEGRPEEQQKEPVISEEALMKAVLFAENDDPFGDTIINRITERFGPIEVPPGGLAFFYE